MKKKIGFAVGSGDKVDAESNSSYPGSSKNSDYHESSESSYQSSSHYFTKEIMMDLGGKTKDEIEYD
jgi:hypothetical protein